MKYLENLLFLLWDIRLDIHTPASDALVKAIENDLILRGLDVGKYKLDIKNGQHPKYKDLIL